MPALDSSPTPDEFANPYEAPRASGSWMPYEAPRASGFRVSRQTVIRPWRRAFLGAVLGGLLGLTPVLVIIVSMVFTPEPPGEEIGPMVVALFPFLAAGFVVACATGGGVLGLFFGFLSWSIACMSDRAERRAQGPFET